MKRKVLSIILSVGMMAALLAGCGNSSAPAEEAPAETEEVEEEEAAPAEETEPETEAETEESEETEASSGDEWTLDVEGIKAKAQAQDNSEIKLSYVSMNLANPWNAMVKKGFEAACEELGVTYQVIDSEYSVDTQVNALETLINDGYSGFTFTPIDTAATIDLADKANEAGIITACIAQTQDNVLLSYTLDEYDYGYTIGEQAGEWIRDNLDGKAQVCIISQDNVESVIPRGDGLEDALKAVCPDVEIVARQAGDTLEGGMTIVESVLAQYPDMNVVVGTNDSGAIGGYQAMVNAGCEGENYAVFSGDATDEALTYIAEENSIYRGTVDLFPYKGGYESAYYLYLYATEGAPESQNTVYLPYVKVPKTDVMDGTYTW
ncbi:sugar ABC transporter substrate-binding protein [Lachnospiraceae bacterium 38-10]